MFELYIRSNNGEFKDTFSTKGAAFARLKLLYPNPEEMRSFGIDSDYMDFMFKNNGESITGWITKKHSDDESE